MNAALSWLNDLIQWLGRWIPRLVLIHPTHRGVKFGPRGRTTQVGPGLVVYWPITHDLLQVPVTTQSIQLCGQILQLPDSAAIVPRVAVCTLNVQFTITDAVKAATKVLHFQALVSNRAHALAAHHWERRTNRARSVRARAGRESTWVRDAEADLRAEMIDYGIHLLSLDSTGIGIGVVLKNVSDWSYADSSNGKRPD